MNGPTVDCGKAPVEFRGLCLRLSAMALKTKNGGKKKKKEARTSISHSAFLPVHPLGLL